jgi:hypothetical protein
MKSNKGYADGIKVPPARDSWSRTKCPTPDALDRILNEGKLYPDMSADPSQQRPQDAVDQRAKNYSNDTKCLSGEKLNPMNHL